jgi:transcriptional regulator with XRE-family HTH domain
MSDLDGQEREALTAHIAERLREARAGKNWSQDQLANECGWTQAAVSLYEAGHRRTGIYELCVLAEKLERPLAFFLDQLPRVAALAVRDEPPDDVIQRAKALLLLIRNLADALEITEDAQDPLQDATDEALLDEADALLARHGIER